MVSVRYNYSVLGMEQLFAVKRKTIQDLVGCCIGENRGRFERELHRLRGFRFRRLRIVGSELEIKMQQYHSRLAPKVVFSTLSTSPKYAKYRGKIEVHLDSDRVGFLFSDGRLKIGSFGKELLVVQELAWNPNGCRASFRSHFNYPVAHIDALQIH